MGHKASVRTNAQGVASFRIVGVKPTGYQAVSLSAQLADPQYHYVYSASGNFDLEFVKR
jgi:hypothetical protein